MSTPLQVTVLMDGNTWQNRAQYIVHVANPTSTAVTSGWTVTLNVKPSVRFESLWNAVLVTQNDQFVVVKNPSWIGSETIAAKSSVSFGGIVSFADGTAPPFILWGTGSTGTVPPPTPTPTPTPVPPGTLTAPVMQPIANSGQAEKFQVLWTASTNGTLNPTVSYTLHMATNNLFTTGVVNYPATQGTSMNVAVVQGAVPVTYYFRVGAQSGSVVSDLSNTVQTTVAAAVGPPQPAPPLGPLQVQTFWESWGPESATSAASAKFDTANVSFVRVTGSVEKGYKVDGLDCPVSKMQEFIDACHKLGKKVKVSYGGASYAYDVATTLTSSATNAGVAKALADYVKQYKLDGVDLDFEASTPNATLQIDFIKQLRALLPNADISYTPETPVYATEPWKSTCVGAASYLTFIMPMLYNNYSTYDWRDDMNRLVAMGVPRSKIILCTMPGPDDQRRQTSLKQLEAYATAAKTEGYAGVAVWSLNRDMSNATGLGANTVHPLLYSVLHPATS